MNTGMLILLYAIFFIHVPFFSQKSDFTAFLSSSYGDFS